MASFHLAAKLLTTFLLLAALHLQLSSSATTYIIHTNNSTRPSRFATQSHWYSSILLRSLSAAPIHRNNTEILYTYRTVLHGFAASLSPQQAQMISRMPGVIGVYKDTVMKLLTTRSPEFLGLNSDFGLWPESNFGENVTIGIVDSGIWPESEAFRDTGLPPVDARWLGKCENDSTFDSRLCNNKLVGAWLFTAAQRAMAKRCKEDPLEFNSPRDADGHGTLMASIAAGAPVANANMFGFANGTARGMATRARIAMYKACTTGGCFSSDILAAIEKAIEDSVDVLSISLGSNDLEEDFYHTAISIGTFHAVQRGIFVAGAAGNYGPYPRTISNEAPWITTVGAGSIDRRFPSRVILGNGEMFVGESLYAKGAKGIRLLPLVFSPTCSDLEPDLIMGKIVVCHEFEPVFIGFSVQASGGAGMIVVSSNNTGEGLEALPFTLPALTVGYHDGMKIKSYINSTENPMASLAFDLRTVVGDRRAPTVAPFSARGPSRIVPEILKPDVIAPGMNILAAWSHVGSPSELNLDTRKVKFNIQSGTSISTPHVAGVAALLRAAHPTWSPAMIRSAMMTTADTLDHEHRPIILDENSEPATPLAMGAGHINPAAASDPGLVYDADGQDYINLLCTLNYTSEQMAKFVPAQPYACSKIPGGAAGFNYPSFVVVFDESTRVQRLRRTLTKVSGGTAETYMARVVKPRGDVVEVSVEPERLEFREMKERRSYEVEFRSKAVGGARKKRMEYGHIVWESGEHRVRSPVVFVWK